MNEFRNWNGVEFIAPVGPITITLQLAPVDVELALISNGTSLCSAIVTALIAEMSVDTADVSVWHEADELY